MSELGSVHAYHISSCFLSACSHHQLATDMVRKHPEYGPVLTMGPKYVDYFHHDGHVEKKAVYDDGNLIAKFGLINCDLC